MTKNPEWRNWSGSIRCNPNHISTPLSVEEVQAEVLRCAEEGERTRPIGRGGSFAPLCWSDENLMSLERFRGVERIDLDARQAWVRAGTPVRVLARQLGDCGLGLPLVTDEGTETLGGVLAAGSHASTLRNAALSAHVLALRVVFADGTVRTVSAHENREWEPALRLGLGSLGVITHVHLQCLPVFRLRERIESLPLQETFETALERASRHASFRFAWTPGSNAAQVYSADTTDAPATGEGGLQWLTNMLAPDAGRWVLDRLGRRAPRLSQRIRRMATRTRPVRETVRDGAAYPFAPLLHRYTETEHYVAIERLPELLPKLDRLLRGPRLHIPVMATARFCRGDSAWLSPTQGRDAACIGLRFDPASPAEPVLAALRPLLASHGARPHWGKLHARTAEELPALYPQWSQFLSLRRQLDPRGVFLNPQLAALFGVSDR